jgi:GT2 family glycosyltransferase
MLASGEMDPDCHRGFPTPWASITYFSGLERLFPKSRIFGQYHQHYLNLNKVHEIDAGFGTFMMVRREVIDQVGGWDDQYFFYGEDLDYFYRIKKAGWKVMFYSKPLLTHHKGASSGLRKESRAVTRASRETRVKTAQESIRAMEIFYKKFYQDRYPRVITFLVVLGIKIKGLTRIFYHQFLG